MGSEHHKPLLQINRGQDHTCGHCNCKIEEGQTEKPVRMKAGKGKHGHSYHYIHAYEEDCAKALAAAEPWEDRPGTVIPGRARPLRKGRPPDQDEPDDPFPY